MTTTLLPLIYIYYRDINEQGPRGGCGFFSQRRQVKAIEPVQGGEQGVIQYKGKQVPVYRKTSSSTWSTNKAELEPTRVFYL